MSTALLEDNTVTTDEPQELVLDAVTRQRLEVAACAVETLEELADTGAWDRLDSALADHLVEHARRLSGFLERVRRLPAVRACEQEMLAVRRTERRLEVALDLLVEEEVEVDEAAPVRQKRRRKKKDGDELFFGDFSEKTLTDEQRQDSRERRRERKAKKQLLTPRGKRIALYITACVVLTAASLTMVALGALEGMGKEELTVVPVAEPMKANEYLEDMRVFLPAKMMMVQGNTGIVMVRREWLLKSQDQRQVDADGAHVFLSNRAITRLELLWEDGGLIASAEKDGHAVFAEGTSGIQDRARSEKSEAPATLGAPAGP